MVRFFEKGVRTRKMWYHQLDPGRNRGKTNPLNDDDLEGVCRAAKDVRRFLQKRQVGRKMTSSSNSVPGSAQTINYTINSDPSLAPGLAAEPGALCARTDLPGIYCHTGPLDTDWSPMGGCSLQPPFPDPPIVFTIYARTFGSDTTGSGTLANPYRTFKEAVRHINSSSAISIYIAAGYRFIVDVTDLGVEKFPPGYAHSSLSWRGTA